MAPHSMGGKSFETDEPTKNYNQNLTKFVESFGSGSVRLVCGHCVFTKITKMALWTKCKQFQTIGSFHYDSKKQEGFFWIGGFESSESQSQPNMFSQQTPLPRVCCAVSLLSIGIIWELPTQKARTTSPLLYRFKNSSQETIILSTCFWWWCDKRGEKGGILKNGKNRGTRFSLCPPVMNTQELCTLVEN